MEIVSNVILNLQTPAYSTVYAPQGDTLTRKVRAQLMDGSTPWEVPDGATMVIRYRKPDGTVGYYDTDELGNAAYTVSGEYVTFTLAAQSMTVAGAVYMQLDFYAANDQHLSTFTLALDVSAAVVADGEIASEDYINALTRTAAQLAQDMHIYYGAPRAAASADDMTDHDLVYVYTGTTTASLTNGHWYYWSGSAWADGGVYNSTAFTTDTTLTVSGAAADAKVTGDKIGDVRSATTALSHVPEYTWNIGKYIDASGNISAVASYGTTDMTNVSGGDKYIRLTPTKDAQNRNTAAYLCTYKTVTTLNDTFVARIGINTTPEIVFDDIVTGYCIVYGRASSLGVDFSQTDIDYWRDEVYRKGASLEDYYSLLADEKTLEGDVANAESNLATLNTDTYALSHLPKYSWKIGEAINASGGVYSSNYNALTDIVPASAADIYKRLTPLKDANNINFAFYLCTYKTVNSLNDTFIERIGLASHPDITFGEDVTGYRISFGRGSSTGVVFTETDLDYWADIVYRKGASLEQLYAMSHKTSLKILSIGNSFSQDALSYAPFVFRGLTNNVDLTIGISYKGGADIDTYINYFDNDTNDLVYDVITPSDSVWAINGSQTLKQILLAEKWDIITLQQSSDKQGDISTYANLGSLIDKIANYLMANNRTAKIGWLIPHTRASYPATNYTDMIECLQTIMGKYAIDFVLPCGTAMQNARGTTLNQYGDYSGGGMSEDGSHNQEGIGCLVEAYASVLKLLEISGCEYKGILGEGTRPDAAWITAKNIPNPDLGTGVVGISDANCLIAQKCAVAAIKKPYEVSEIN